MRTLIAMGLVVSQCWFPWRGTAPAQAQAVRTIDKPAAAPSASDVAKDAVKEFGEDSAEAPPPISFRPWAEGVSEANQLRARSLFQEGNSLLRESLFSQAIQKYQEALSHWDHPAIHYNHALALSTLDQPIKTREELLSAIKYGAGPLGQDQFQQAQRYKALVEKQLVNLTVECSSPLAAVTLNGKPLFNAPGRFEGFVMPGEQLISASKEGYIADERAVTLIPGKPTLVRLAVYTEEQLTKYERLWPEYPPWIVVGTGAAVAAAGAWFYFDGQNVGDEYNALSRECATTETLPFAEGNSVGAVDVRSYDNCRLGAETGDRMQELDDKARLYNRVGISMLAGGGAVLATGAVLLYLNRARPYRLRPQELQARVSGVEFSAAVGPGAAFVLGRGNF